MATPTCGSERQKSHYLTLFVSRVPWAGRRDGLRCHSTLDCIHCPPPSKERIGPFKLYEPDPAPRAVVHSLTHRALPALRTSITTGTRHHGGQSSKSQCLPVGRHRQARQQTARRIERPYPLADQGPVAQARHQPGQGQEEIQLAVPAHAPDQGSRHQPVHPAVGDPDQGRRTAAAIVRHHCRGLR
ncbi:hypothetical protein EMIT048CA2_70042 [Pseudomonas chlororaphis]